MGRCYRWLAECAGTRRAASAAARSERRENGHADRRTAQTRGVPNMALRIGVPKETAAGEKRVATVPDVVEKLVKLGFSVAVQSGAGDAANFADDTYRAAGAQVIEGAASLFAAADIVFKI